jgi:NADH-quinone oxidoreductase subunit E
MDLSAKKQLDDILSNYTGDTSDLIPILQAAQERFGYLPEEIMVGIAQFLKLPPSAVYGVSTFYAQFKLTPTGRRTVKVCRGTACHVRGAERILQEIEKQLNIKPGETTEDLEYSLETIACFGSCALAPVTVVDKTVHGRVTPQKVAQILTDTK